MYEEIGIIVPIITTTPGFIYLIDYFLNWRIRKKQREIKIESIFGFLQDSEFTTGNIPPDDIDSLRIFKDWFYNYFKRGRNFEYLRDISSPDINKDLCSIGGPVDHRLTRYGMFYEKKIQYWEPVLPYIYPIEEAILRRESGEKDSVMKRWWKGEEWTSPNWYIADRYGKPRFIPKLDDDGYLKTDYMMLIISPNTLTRKALNQNKKHLMIAPAHGLAQLAIENVLESKLVLDEIIKIRKESEYFQAIIEVPGKLTKYGYMPNAPKGFFPLIDVQPLDIDEFKNLPSYKEWLKKK